MRNVVKRALCVFYSLRMGEKAGRKHGQEVRGLRLQAWRLCHCLAVTLGRNSTLPGSLLLIYLINSEQPPCLVGFSVSWTTLWHDAFFYLKGAGLSMASGQKTEKRALYTSFFKVTSRLGSKESPSLTEAASLTQASGRRGLWLQTLANAACSPTRGPSPELPVGKCGH